MIIAYHIWVFNIVLIKNIQIIIFQQWSQNNNDPFSLVSSIGCHSQFTVEDKYKGIDDNNRAPRTDNFKWIT